MPGVRKGTGRKGRGAQAIPCMIPLASGRTGTV